MVTALRCLRFCYSSNLVQREPFLFGLDWEQRERIPPQEDPIAVANINFSFADQRQYAGERRTHGRHSPVENAGGGGPDFRVTQRSGIGMMASMAFHGFGWWCPSIFDWTTLA